ncbi:hypothetical protein GCM10028799_08760 [Kribbella italica]
MLPIGLSAPGTADRQTLYVAGLCPGAPRDSPGDSASRSGGRRCRRGGRQKPRQASGRLPAWTQTGTPPRWPDSPADSPSPRVPSPVTRIPAGVVGDAAGEVGGGEVAAAGK